MVVVVALFFVLVRADIMAYSRLLFFGGEATHKLKLRFCLCNILYIT
jgi:hypothetical protein